jgi:hypothetical protein
MGAAKAFEADVAKLSPDELKRQWSEAWGMPPPSKISRTMLQKSLAFKLRETAGLGLTPEQQEKLNRLVAAYKRNPAPLRELKVKPGTRLIRTWQGSQYDVLVRTDGYEFQGRKFKSLSEIAKNITGTSWNGWRFFGITNSLRAGVK